MVVASVGECPLTVLEAMSSGLPVLLNDDPALHSPWTAGPGVRFVDMAAGELREALERPGRRPGTKQAAWARRDTTTSWLRSPGMPTSTSWSGSIETCSRAPSPIRTERPTYADVPARRRNCNVFQPFSISVQCPFTRATSSPGGSDALAEQFRIAAIVPCHNEEAAVAKVVADLHASVPGMTVYVYDNCSTDRTIERAQARRRGRPSRAAQGQGQRRTPRVRRHRRRHLPAHRRRRHLRRGSRTRMIETARRASNLDHVLGVRREVEGTAAWRTARHTRPATRSSTGSSPASSATAG